MAAPRPRLWTLAFTTVVLLSGLAVLIFLGAVIVMVLQPGHDPEAALERVEGMIDTIRGTLFVTSLSSLWFGAVAVAAAALSPKPFLDRLSLRLPQVSILVYAFAVLGGAAMGEAIDAFMLWSGLGRGDTIEDMLGLFRRLRGVDLAVALVVVGGLAGTAEELLFRGYYQTRLTERFGAFAGIAIASIAFGLAHVEPHHAAFALCFGFYVGWLSWRARSIWPAIVVHVTNNAMSTWMAAMGMGETPSRMTSAAHLAVGLVVFVITVFALRRLLPR